jgi:hypothetical protein
MSYTKSYAVTYSGNRYTITFADATSVSFNANLVEYTNHSNPNYFYFGAFDQPTLLDYTKCTSPTAASRALLVTAIQNLDTQSEVDLSSISADIVPDTASSRNLGSISKPWNIVCTDNILVNSSTVFPIRSINRTALTIGSTNSVPVNNASGDLSDITLTNGQIVIGKTGALPVAATITGTTNQVNVANGSGTITLSTPQDIATTSTPTFSAVTTNNISSSGSNNLILTTAGTGVIAALKLVDTSSGVGIKLPTTNGTATTLDFYENTTHSTTFHVGTSGTSASVTIKLTRIGNVVYCRIPATTWTSGTGSGNTLISDTALPNRYIPSGANPATSCASIFDNSALFGNGMILVTTSGIFNIRKSSQASFTSSTTVGWSDDMVFSYVI